MINNSYPIFIIALIGLSFFLTILFTPLLRKYALKHGIVDYPDNKIKKHAEIKPYLGGISIFFALFIAVVIISLISIYNFHPEIFLSFKQLVIIWQIFFCATIIMLLGLIDDIKNLSPYIKLIVQFIVAIIIIRYDIQIQIRFLPDIVNEILTVIWIVTMTNAANLIDIMDGLCSGVIAIAAATFIITGLITHNYIVTTLACIITGCCAGFLPYNFKNASIYLGDAGSLLLGFLMSLIAVSMSYTEKNILGIILPLVILAIPLFDTFLICYFRIKAGKSPILGSNDHFALRLNYLGFSKTETVKLIYLISIVLAGFTILILKSTLTNALILFFTLMLIAVIFSKVLGKIKIIN